MQPPDAMPAALEGIRVVELCDERGEFLGRLLANLGAEVIKVEPPGGASSRNIGPFYQDQPGAERSIYWWHFNIGKLGVTLDLHQEEGLDLLHRLLHDADVLIESFGPERTGKRRSGRMGRSPCPLPPPCGGIDQRLRARRTMGRLRRQRPGRPRIERPYDGDGVPPRTGGKIRRSSDSAPDAPVVATARLRRHDGRPGHAENTGPRRAGGSGSTSHFTERPTTPQRTTRPGT